MTEEIERYKGIVSKVTDTVVGVNVTYINSMKEMREFPKNLFDKDVKVSDEYNFVVTGGSGWMQIDLEKVKPPFVMIDDDDEVSIDFIKRMIDSQDDFEFIDKCKKFAIEQHNRVNQKYGDKPYYYHLKDVVDHIMMFIDLVPRKHRAIVIGAGWNHDTLEDTGITWNNLREATNVAVANIVYAVTNEKGKSRKERANAKYYRGIRNEMFADIVKFADRMSNIKRSFEKFKLDPMRAGSMFDKYHSEHPNFLWSIIKPEWYELSEQIKRLFMGRKKYLKHRIETHELVSMINYMEKQLNQKA